MFNFSCFLSTLIISSPKIMLRLKTELKILRLPVGVLQPGHGPVHLQVLLLVHPQLFSGPPVPVIAE